MVVVKILLLFPPLLLLANAQSGGRLGFYARPNFRRLRPWERPTVAPVPDTPMPTERVTEHITDYPKARTELPTFVSPTSGAPVSSSPTWSPRGRIWSRPGFQGSRPIALSTPTASTPTESITFKADAYSPAVSIVSSTTEPQVYVVTPSKRAPFVENHAQYKDPNNFNARGRFSPKLTHNNDEIPSDSTKTITKFPLTTEKVTEFFKNLTTTPVENSSAMVSLTSTTTTESVTSTTTPTTAVPFINNDLKYNETLNSNLEFSFPTQASLHLNERTTELRTTPKPLTTPRETFIPTRTTSRFPPYMSHNLNEPITRATTVTATKELPSSTTESTGYSIAPSTNKPFGNEQKGYEDIYLATNTPIPFNIISTTEVASATTNQHYPIYQANQKNENNIASESEVLLPKIVTMLPTEPEEYFITTTTKAPFIDVHKEFNNSFTSQYSVEYTNGQQKTSERTSKSDYYNSLIYPIYHHETEEDSHYEQYSSATREPERYTVAIATGVPSTDLDKMYDVGFTTRSPVEYTNGYAKTTEIPISNESKELNHNIYQNNNPKWNNYEHSVTPKFIDTTQSAAHPHWHLKTTTEQSVIAQTARHTNSYRYIDMTTKPTTITTRYTSTTARSSRLKDVYDVENFKCKEENAYYSISNQCDEFIDCKSGHPIQNTCPDGLHFNPAAKYSEFPCAYPSEVKCEDNSVSRQPEPTSECPRRYGYFSMQDGRCDKYIMCQEGKATVMSCPAGLAFSVATSSCDWPANVPDCLPEAFQGFTCPAPELNEDGEPTRSIYKYRYDKSCKKYIACQKGHPRLLSCDSGLAFDENSESCIDEFDVTDCT